MIRRWPNGMPKVAWICDDCVIDLGGAWIDNHVATYHVGECPVCKKSKPITEPRDFAWNGCAGGACD